MAVVRSPDFLRALIRETALATLIHQRRLTPSCGGQAPTAERTVGPARMIAESLTPKPGIREQNRCKADLPRASEACRSDANDPKRSFGAQCGDRLCGVLTVNGGPAGTAQRDCRKDLSAGFATLRVVSRYRFET